MKRKNVVAILILTLMICSAIASASTKINFKPLSMGSQEEYYVYGWNAWSLSGNWKKYGEHSLHMSDGAMPWDDCTATWQIDIACSELGVESGTLQVGVYFLDKGVLGNGPDLHMYDWSKEKFVLIKEAIGNHDNLEWKWFNIGNKYISSDERVKIYLYADFNDETIVDTLGIQYEDKESVDKSQTQVDGSKPLAKGLYQEFTPQFKKLTRVKLLLRPTSQSPGGTLYFYICADINPRRVVGSATAAINFGLQKVVGPDRWAEIDLEDNYIALAPGHKYYLEIGPLTTDSNWCYKGSSSDPDFCFKTYGSSSCDLAAKLKTDPDDGGTLNFGTVKKGSTSPVNLLTIKNTGDEGSVLEWEITDKPSWVILSETSGICYNPHGSGSDWVFILVELDINELEGCRQGKPYSGKIRVEADTGESSEITVKVTVLNSRSRDVSIYNLLEKLLDQFPILAQLLQL